MINFANPCTVHTAVLAKKRGGINKRFHLH